jgi:hypothetical protein
LFNEDESPYRSPVKREGNMVTLNKKKDILSEDFISSGFGGDFEENLRKSLDELKKEVDDREACFITAYNEVHETNLTAEDIDDRAFNDIIDLCELYHRLRAGKRILK